MTLQTLSVALLLCLHSGHRNILSLRHDLSIDTAVNSVASRGKNLLLLQGKKHAKRQHCLDFWTCCAFGTFFSVSFFFFDPEADFLFGVAFALGFRSFVPFFCTATLFALAFALAFAFALGLERSGCCEGTGSGDGGCCEGTDSGLLALHIPTGVHVAGEGTSCSLTGVHGAGEGTSCSWTGAHGKKTSGSSPFTSLFST